MNQRYHESEWRDAIVSNIGNNYATGSRRADRPGASVRTAKRRALIDAARPLIVAALLLAPWFFL
jgi:hypothetical protein